MQKFTFDEYLLEAVESSDKFTWADEDVEVDGENLNEDVAGDHYRNPAQGGKESIAKHKPSDKSMAASEAHHKSLSPETRKALDKYTGQGYKKVNSDLRKGKANDQTKHLDHVTGHKLTEDHHVYRSFGGKLHVDKLAVGAKIKEKGYTSTSHHYDVTHSFRSNNGGASGSSKTVISHKVDGKQHHHTFTAKIHLPKGTKAHNLENKASKEHHEGEKEVLVHRGTTFRVTGHTVHSTPHPDYNDAVQHHHIVHMTVHHQD